MSSKSDDPRPGICVLCTHTHARGGTTSMRWEMHEAVLVVMICHMINQAQLTSNSLSVILTQTRHG